MGLWWLEQGYGYGTGIDDDEKQVMLIILVEPMEEQAVVVDTTHNKQEREGIVVTRLTRGERHPGPCHTG